MQHPLGIGVLTPGIHRYRPGARLTHSAHHHLQLNPTGARQHQRCSQHQLLDHRAADLISCPNGQLDEPGPGKDHHPGHHVIGQPPLHRHRQPPGQHHRAVGLMHHRTQ